MLEFSNLPGAAEWLNIPLAFARHAADELAITAGAQTDWFFDPAGNVQTHNAPVCLFAPDTQSFTLHARVTVAFASDFDAGVLFVYGDETHWAKLCFEFSPQAEPMLVSVVTRGVSDDCNSVVVSGNTVFLRVYCHKNIWAFHYSPDGAYWHFVRYFDLGVYENVRVGFSAQSPTGSGCSAVFSSIAYQARTLNDVRSGE
jgi:hypothetical protein